MIAFHALLTEDGDRFGGMQFHPDAESMVLHLQVVKEAVADISGSLENLIEASCRVDGRPGRRRIRLTSGSQQPLRCSVG